MHTSSTAFSVPHQECYVQNRQPDQVRLRRRPSSIEWRRFYVWVTANTASFSSDGIMSQIGILFWLHHPIALIGGRDDGFPRCNKLTPGPGHTI